MSTLSLSLFLSLSDIVIYRSVILLLTAKDALYRTQKNKLSSTCSTRQPLYCFTAHTTNNSKLNLIKTNTSLSFYLLSLFIKFFYFTFFLFGFDVSLNHQNNLFCFLGFWGCGFFFFGIYIDNF